MDGILALLLNSFISGALSPLFVRLGTSEIPVFLFTSIRFLIASVVFLPFVLSVKKIDKKHRKSLFFYSLFFSGNAIFFGLGLQFTTVLVSQVLYATVPIFTGIFSYLLIKERFSLSKILGAILALIGVLFIFYQSAQMNDSFSLGTPLGNIIILAGVICWSFYLVFTKKLTKIYSPAVTSFTSYIITFLLATLIIPFELLWVQFSVLDVTTMGLGSLVGVGVISSAFSFYLIQYGVKKTTAFTASLFFYLSPLFSSLTAVSILHEKITFELVLGCVLILIGVFLATTYGFLKNRNK